MYFLPVEELRCWDELSYWPRSLPFQIVLTIPNLQFWKQMANGQYTLPLYILKTQFEESLSGRFYKISLDCLIMSKANILEQFWMFYAAIVDTFTHSTNTEYLLSPRPKWQLEVHIMRRCHEALPRWQWPQCLEWVIYGNSWKYTSASPPKWTKWLLIKETINISFPNYLSIRKLTYFLKFPKREICLHVF